jgi:hypothetical protein
MLKVAQSTNLFVYICRVHCQTFPIVINIILFIFYLFDHELVIGISQRRASKSKIMK